MNHPIACFRAFALQEAEIKFWDCIAVKLPNPHFLDRFKMTMKLNEFTAHLCLGV